MTDPWDDCFVLECKCFVDTYEKLKKCNCIMFENHPTGVCESCKPIVYLKKLVSIFESERDYYKEYY